MNIVVIIPTYRERDNIIPLLNKLLLVTKNLPGKFKFLVVDDNSPDGTGKLVKDFLKNQKTVFLLSGKKQGLGVAYIRGFAFALKNLGADAVVEMDADFSHRPEELPRLVKNLEKGDFIIGSRYIKGGRVPQNWGFLRRANSRWGNRFARYLAGIDDVRDCTSGYRAIRREVLEKINLSKLKVQGYSFQMNLLYRAYVNGAKIREVPIHFEERAWGRTKIGPLDILEFIWNSVKLRFEQGLEGLDKKALRAQARRTIQADQKLPIS